MSDLSAYLDCAVEAAKQSGRIQRSHVGGELRIDTKSSDTDLVTQIDKLCETTIREFIAGTFPDHTVLGEEQGMGTRERASAFRWIVDPIDGTTNFAHAFPFYCTSIGLELDGEPIVGVVYDASRDELFTATRGGGAFMNGQRIRVTTETVLKSSMLTTGFAPLGDRTEANLDAFARMLPLARSIRLPGAAALCLCYVAAGRADGFWELGLKPWDVAAGMLIVREAGGSVTREGGEAYRLGDQILVASNGQLHETLTSALDLGGLLA